MSTDHRLQIVLAAKDVTGTAFKKLQGRMTALMKSAVSLRGGMVALAGAAGLGMLVKSSLNAADKLGKTADKLGITTDALQEYQFAASQSGVATRTMEMGLQRFTRRMAEAVQGKGELKGILEQYNITLKDTAGNTRASTDVLEDLADVIKHTEDPAERLRIAFKAFDSEGVALLNTMKNGSQGLNAYAKEARDLGIIMDKELIRASEKANDELDKLSKVIKVNFQTAVVSVAPYLTEVATQTNNWIKNNQELLKQEIPAYLDAITDSFSSMVKAIESVSAAYGKISGFMKAGFAPRIGSDADIEQSGYELFGGVPPDYKPMAGVQDNEALAASMTFYKEAIAKTADETTRLVENTKQLTEATVAEAQAMASAEAEAAELMAAFQQQLDQMNGIVSDTSTWDLMQEQLNKTAEVANQVSVTIIAGADEAARAYRRVADQISGTMSNAIMDMIEGTKSAKEAFRDMARDIIRNLMQMIIKQIIFNAISSSFGGGFAKGGVFDQSGLVPFAQGGVVNKPTVFPFASGVGLMAENGPEAIMPLTRTSGGDLGVKAEGGGEGVSQNYFVINAMDPRSFNEYVRRNPSAITRVVGDDLQNNGSLRSIMRRTM